MYNLVAAVGMTTDVDSAVLDVGLTVVTKEQNTFLHDFTQVFFLGQRFVALDTLCETEIYIYVHGGTLNKALAQWIFGNF